MTEALHKGQLRIPKLYFTELCALFLLFFPFCFGFLLEFIGLPSFIKYAMDAVWVSSLVLLLFKRKFSFQCNMLAPLMLIVVFLLYTLITHLFHLQSPFYFLWGFRNNFRYYAAFIIFAMILSEDVINGCMKALEAIYVLNLAVCLFQFFFLELKWDYLGGIFGTETGCNGYLVVFYSIMLTRSFLRYMNGEENPIWCYLKCGLTLICAALSELKFFFIIFVVILVLCTVLSKASWRKFLMIFVGALFLVVSTTVMGIVFENSDLLSPEKLFQMITQTNYASQDDFGRLSSILQISNLFLTSFWERMFGLGLGNCDTSAFAICNSTFFRTYGNLNYIWFSCAMWFLETGFIGMALFLGFFVLCGAYCFRQIKRDPKNKVHYNTAIVTVAVCFMLFFYNSSLRMESAYMIYFISAVPFALGKNRRSAEI